MGGAGGREITRIYIPCGELTIIKYNGFWIFILLMSGKTVSKQEGGGVIYLHKNYSPC